jgi:acyl-CoA synthetase (AMP-forming)/AMP-acid ligase II
MYPGTHAATTPDKPAYVMWGSGEVVTYKQLDDRSNQLAQLLYDRGLRRGDAIAICMENHARYLEVVWAAQRSGLYYTCISYRLTAPEIEYVVTDCGASAFISSRVMAEQVAELNGKLPKVHTRLMLDGAVDGWESYEDVVGAQPAKPLDEEFEGNDLLYSSGTTGRPKGVKLPLP